MPVVGSGTAALRAKAALVADPTSSWLLVLPLQVAGQHVLVLAGTADVSTAAELRDQLVAAVAVRPSRLRVELDGLERCDQAGLGVLQAAVTAAADHDVLLTLSGAPARLDGPHRASVQRSLPRPGAGARSRTVPTSASRHPAPSSRRHLQETT